MTKPDPDKAIRSIVRRALVREAKERLRTGLRLHHGRWLTDLEYQSVRWQGRVRIGRETVETLLLWALGALLGLGLMVLAVLIL